MSFRIASTTADTTVITGEGRLNAASVPDLRQQLDGAFDAGARSIVVDMTSVDFIDSTGLGALIQGLRRARALGGDLRLVAPGAQVSMVLGLANLDRVLPSYPSVTRATTEVSS